MADSQSPQQTNPLKRKASTEVPLNNTFPADQPTQNAALFTTVAGNSVELPTQNEAPGASTYQQTYAETAAEIKKLLKEYSLAAGGNNHNVPEYHNNTKDELQAILNDIANRPEYAEMDEMKNLLRDCGIEIHVRQNADGAKVVDVQLKVE